MTSQWNQALLLAQQVIKKTADRLPDREVAYNTYGPHQDKSGLDKDVTMLGDLILPEETTE